MMKLLIYFAIVCTLPIQGDEIVELQNDSTIQLVDNQCPASVTYYTNLHTLLTLECPHQPIEWIQKVKLEWNYSFRRLNSTKLTLTIEHFNYDNEGCYCCRSAKDYSVACTSIKVMGPPRLRPFYNFVQLINVYCDEPFSIACPYDAYPVPNFTWIFQNKTFEPLRALPNIVKDQIHNPVIHVDRFYSELIGKYKCLAENRYGNISDKKNTFFHLSYPKNCQGYLQYRGVNLNKEYTGSIGGNVTMRCVLQFTCSYEGDICAEKIQWDDSLFPPNRTIKEIGSNCSRCTVWQSRTIVNLQRSDFNKTYSCVIQETWGHSIINYLNTTIKTASEFTQSFNPVPALVPTAVILLILITTATVSITIGIRYKKKITMFFYYRLAKEPPYKKGLKYDVFISFASKDKKFVEEKIHDPIKRAEYKVIWYPDDFLAGDLILEKAKDSIWKSRKTIICLSNSFLESDYCEAEKNYCLEKAMETFKNFLIIIHLDDCPIPSELKKLKIIEMRDQDFDPYYLPSDYFRAFSNLKYLLKAPISTQ